MKKKKKGFTSINRKSRNPVIQKREKKRGRTEKGERKKKSKR